MQILETRDSQGVKKVPAKNGGQARREDRFGCGGGGVNLEGPPNRTAADELAKIRNLSLRIHKRIRSLPAAATDAKQREKICMEWKSSESLPEYKAGAVWSASARHAHG